MGKIIGEETGRKMQSNKNGNRLEKGNAIHSYDIRKSGRARQ